MRPVEIDEVDAMAREYAAKFSLSEPMVKLGECPPG